MADKASEQKQKKGFFSKMIDGWDKKLEEKSKVQKCCCGPGKDKGKSCCS